MLLGKHVPRIRLDLEMRGERSRAGASEQRSEIRLRAEERAELLTKEWHVKVDAPRAPKAFGASRGDRLGQVEPSAEGTRLVLFGYLMQIDAFGKLLENIERRQPK